MVIKPLLEKARKKKADKVFIATDPDREGEFIAWRLSEIFGDFSTQRITFNEITENAVVAALSDPRSVDESLVNAAKVRRFMDRLVGFRSSKFSKSWSLKSMGRVQTPTLGFIVERELEREAFVPQPFYAVDAEAGGLTFKARFHEKEDPDAWFDRDAEPPKHHPYRTNDLSLANLARSTINEEGGVQVTNTKDGTRSSSPKPPFSTPSLLRTAGSHPKIGWGSKKIMQVASSLYNAGHITYMRTDSTRTNPEARSEVRQYIVSQWGSEHLRPEPGVGGEVQKGKKNVQDAHEAIRPTDSTVLSPDGLDDQQNILYRLIWARFAASQMSNAKFETLSIRAKVGGFERPWTSSISWRIHSGWEAAFGELRAQPLTSPPEPPIEVGRTLYLDENNKQNPRLIEDETKPPARYRQHTLVEKMQNEGIGRPSTYASTIDKLLDEKRKYLVEDNGALKPTEGGKTLWLSVAPMYGSGSNSRGVFEAHFTAEMEVRLDSIENGETPAPEIWHSFVSEFKDAHDHALDLRRQTPTPKQLAYMLKLLAAVPKERRSLLLDGRDPESISGEDAKLIIETLKNEDVQAGPSEKQLKFISSLLDGLELKDSEAAQLVDLNSLDELTGGRNGTASDLIGQLKILGGDKPRPISDRQAKYLRDLAKKAEMDEGEMCSEHGCKTFEELNASEASEFISKLRDSLGIKGNRRRRKSQF